MLLGLSGLVIVYAQFYELVCCSVVASKDFEEEKGFCHNEEKLKEKQEKRSLMSNEGGEDDYL